MGLGRVTVTVTVRLKVGVRRESGMGVRGIQSCDGGGMILMHRCGCIANDVNNVSACMG